MKIEKKMEEQNETFISQLVGYIFSLNYKEMNEKRNKSYKYFSSIISNKNINSISFSCHFIIFKWTRPESYNKIIFKTQHSCNGCGCGFGLSR